MNLIAKTNRIGRTWGLVLAGAALSLLTVTCLGVSAFSFQVAQAANALADAQQFVGTWTAEHQGTPFIVLDLHMAKGKLAGGIRMASNFRMDTEGSGVVIEITDKTLLASLPARNLRVSDKSMTFDFRDYDGEESHCKLEVTAGDAGRLSWVGLPEGIKAPPIPVTRGAGKSH